MAARGVTALRRGGGGGGSSCPSPRYKREFSGELRGGPVGCSVSGVPLRTCSLRRWGKGEAGLVLGVADTPAPKGKPPKASVCPSNRTPISGLLNKFHVFHEDNPSEKGVCGEVG